MILVIFFLSTALLAQGLPSQSVFDSWNSDARIVGGSDAKDREFKPMALIWWMIEKGALICGGTIINERFILTAAHCMHRQNATTMTAQVGSKLVTKSGTSYPADKYIIHKGYNKKTVANDIALLHVTINIVMTKDVSKISLSTSSDTKAGQIGTIIGWGMISTDGPFPTNLQKTSVPTISLSDCKKAYQHTDLEKTMGPGQMCTSTKLSKGTCQGDSGGPLLGSDGKQIGITSTGYDKCASGSYPDVFTRVSEYINWITTNSKL